MLVLAMTDTGLFQGNSPAVNLHTLLATLDGYLVEIIKKSQVKEIRTSIQYCGTRRPWICKSVREVAFRHYSYQIDMSLS